ncbi:hypothetical protein [Vagococcus carniphilus]
MTIRHYEEKDKSEVITLIKQTIQLINQKDYTPNQILVRNRLGLLG